MRLVRVSAVVLISLPMTVIAVRSIAIGFHRMTDPCIHWGNGHSSSGSLTVAAKIVPVEPRTKVHSGIVFFPPDKNVNDPCAGHIGYVGGTKIREALIMLIVPGGVILAIGLGLAGAGFARSNFLVAGGAVMLLETFPTIFSVAPLALLTGGAFLVLASRLFSDSSQS